MCLKVLILFLAAASLLSCSTNPARTIISTSAPKPSEPVAKAVENPFPVVHVFVALCDNVNQGIVPVPPSLGNGDDPASNLYWGAGFGVKSFFRKSKSWKLVAEIKDLSPAVLERVIFQHKTQKIFLIADAYRGKEIKQTTIDFLSAAAGAPAPPTQLSSGDSTITLNTAGSANLVVYVGHDGLMDFALSGTPRKRDEREREAIVLACASKHYFSSALKVTGASPLLWTTNLMAPEAYVLSAALDGWIKKESNEEIRMRAAKAYHSYQNCGLNAASKLFATGW